MPISINGINPRQKITWDAVIISAVSADQDSTEATVCMYTSVQHHNAIINIMLLELLQCTAKGIS